MQVINSGGCAACYSFTTDRLVDLGAAFDGPVLENGMQIDDLVLCENCVRSAAQALSLDNERELVTNALNEAKSENDRAEKWKRYAESLENAAALKPEEVVKKTGRATTASSSSMNLPPKDAKTGRAK